MNFPDIFSYHFYPVGRGLFSTGAIFLHDVAAPFFLWVYDCGSSSPQKLVENRIQDLKRFVKPRNCIDLLTLSHFDHDHISGVVQLLKEFKSGILMLPYMPLAQRLLIAFEERSGGADDPLTDFYLNPVAFLLAQDGPGVERILFVLPSGNDGPAYPGDLPSPQDPGPHDEPKMQFDQAKPTDADDAGSLVQAVQQQTKMASVDFLRPGSRITVAACLWEFIPYNDDPQNPITEAFLKRVDAERVNLLSATIATSRDESLERLKKAYDDHFGAGPEERNVISLFLYSGPIYSSWKTCSLRKGKSMPRTALRWWRQWPFPAGQVWNPREPPDEPSPARCSILYSGDGYLDTNDKLQRLIKYVDERRVRRIGVFQVMHHGAEANWHQGTAQAIAPLFSVFSSDPERSRWNHPHAPVLRDFWGYGAVQVDMDANFIASGHLSK